MNKQLGSEEKKLPSQVKPSPRHGRPRKNAPVCTTTCGKVVAQDGERVGDRREGRPIRPRV